MSQDSVRKTKAATLYIPGVKGLLSELKLTPPLGELEEGGSDQAIVSGAQGLSS